MKRTTTFYLLCITALLTSCNNSVNPDDRYKNPPDGIYRIPIVVHVVHLGEPVGEGHNLSFNQIQSQIRILNEDFRKKEGTRGYNDHPDGGDAMIEFTLAKTDPQGNPTTGVVRINANAESDTIHYHDFEYYASLSYWNPEQYLNVWTEPFADDLTGIVLGKGTGPQTDLPGAELLLDGEPEYREGILINSAHFGESEVESDYNLGRTLTHEIGHYLGVLHTWGSGECGANDYCEDTPAVDKPYGGCAPGPVSSCSGETVMVENFMNYTYDRCVNTFTNAQISRMHYVLENSPYRKSLLTSPGLEAPEAN